MSNVPIFVNQGATGMTVDTGATLTVNGSLVTTGTLAVPAGSIGTAALAAGAVTKAKAGLFISSTQTGNAGVQVLAHGLGVDPTPANVTFSIISTAAAGNFAFTALSTDITNITVTCTNTVQYRIMAWVP